MVSFNRPADRGYRPTLRPGQIRRTDGAILYLLPRTIRHMDVHGDVTFKLLCNAFEHIDLPAERSGVKATIDFGYIVGSTAKIATEAIKPHDTTIFAYRYGRRYPSRVVLGKPKPPTSLLTLVAKRNRAKGELAWELETAYLGSNAPLEPLSGTVVKGRPDIQAEVLNFWCRHALIYNSIEYATAPFQSSWASLCERRKELGPDGFPEAGPYWTGF